MWARRSPVPNESQNVGARIYPRIFTQVSLTVTGKDIFQELQRRVLRWAFDEKRNRYVRGTAQDRSNAQKGKTFEINTEDLEYVAAINLDSPRRWAFSLREDLIDPNCRWRTEVLITECKSDEVAFGCRLTCFQLRSQNTPPLRSIPNFVRGIAFTQEAMLDGHWISAEPWKIHSQDEVNELVAFLKNPTRNHPVVVFALPDGSSDLKDTIIDVKRFVRRTVGYAHTAVITSGASFALTDSIGREFSVYRQAVRTYNRGFDPDKDPPADHPFATADRIRGWGDSHECSFLDFLVDQTLHPRRSRKYLYQQQPSFQKLQRVEREQAHDAARKSGQDAEKLLKLADEALAAQKREAEENLVLLGEAEKERDEARAEAQRVKSEKFYLQQYIERLANKLREAGASPAPDIPESLDEFADWCGKNLWGVRLHTRALRGVDKSKYEDVELIYQSLLLLRDFYVPMKREGAGGIERKEAFEEKCRELGIEEGPSISETGRGEQGDKYIVEHNGSRRSLGRHFKKGNAHDERQCFRLYFFWEEEDQEVVVGWLPSHLPTRHT